MQILNVKIHSELAPTPQTTVLEDYPVERHSRFDEALDSEQERRNFDEQRHHSAAKVADKNGNHESESNEKVTPEEEAKRLEGMQAEGAEGNNSQENDWHDFLQGLYSDREGKGNNDPAETQLSSSSSKTPSEEAEMTLALLDKLGISISEEEKQQLLEGGVLSVSLRKEIQELLSSGAINADAKILYDQLTQFIAADESDVVDMETPEQVELEAALEEFAQGNPEALDNWLNNSDWSAELESALDALVQGDPKRLNDWLAEQDLSPELMASLTNLVNEAAIVLADSEPAVGMHAEIKAALSDILASAVMASHADKSLEPQLNESTIGLAQPSDKKLLQSIEQLVQTLRVSTASESTQQTTTAQVLQPQENKVLAAFSNAASEVRGLLQEAIRDDAQARSDGRDSQLPRGLEQLLTAQGLNESAKNVTSNVAAVTTQPTSQQANMNPLTARAMPAANQPVDTPFEQARQNQQYIDLFGPQAPTQLKEQIAVMFNNRNQFAEMRLDPPELGRLNIRLQMNGDQQASVTFHVTSPQAREAIEFAMPRLREMLEEQGIRLTDSSVREETSQLAKENQQQGGSGSKGTGHSDDDEAGHVEHEQMSTTTMDVPDGRIDYYV